jgi:hypothetical protein
LHDHGRGGLFGKMSSFERENVITDLLFYAYLHFLFPPFLLASQGARCMKRSIARVRQHQDSGPAATNVSWASSREDGLLARLPAELRAEF